MQAALTLLLSLSLLVDSAPPGIIFHVIVDDLGYGDTGFRRQTPTPGIVTPHLDSLVAEGIRLDRHYVHRMCTPSRTSYLSGRLPVHVEVALPNPEDPNCGIPRNMTALPTKLRESPAGYTTAVVGKCEFTSSLPITTVHSLLSLPLTTIYVSFPVLFTMAHSSFPLPSHRLPP